MDNLHYKTSELVKYYSTNRNSWDSIYDSEKKIFEKIFEKLQNPSILDVGCAAGGLAIALSEKFQIKSYTGIDINCDCIEWANKNISLDINTEFVCSDIMLDTKFENQKFDVVLSLSCADWNIRTNDIISKCYSLVNDGGYFIASLRLTDNASVNDINKSFQKIIFDDSNIQGAEIANYVIFNRNEALELFSKLNPKPSSIYGYGYTGKPSTTATTVYDELIFAVFMIEKNGIMSGDIRLDIV